MYIYLNTFHKISKRIAEKYITLYFLSIKVNFLIVMDKSLIERAYK